MQVETWIQRRATAAAEFDAHEQRLDGANITNSLCDGLTLLRNALFLRVHEDVERAFGRDSMLAPVSEVESELKAKGEIEIFQVAVSAVVARDQKYLHSDVGWYSVWLAGLRLGDAACGPHVRRRLARYIEQTPDEQGRTFSDVLVHTYYEARKAPLVLFRLYPLAVEVVTALAFGQVFHAAEARNKQIEILPAISDCDQCHGRPLENGESCRECGNPLWTYRWMTALD